MKHFYKYFIALIAIINSCNLFAQLNVSISPGASCSICVGMTQQFQANVSGGQTPFHYQWSPSLWLSNDSIYNPVCTPPYSLNHDTSIVYTLIVTDNIGSIDTSSILLLLGSFPNFYITSTAVNNKICNGMSTELSCHGNGNYTYNWQYNASLSAQYGTPVIATPTTTTTYEVMAWNGGCPGTSNININVQNCQYNILHGTIYNDIDADGVFNGTDYIMPNYMVNIAPADSVFSYVYDSTYTAYVGQGSFIVTPDNAAYYTQTSNPNINFSGYTTDDTLNVGLYGTLGITDLEVDITPYTYQYTCYQGCAYNFSWFWPYNIGSIGSYIIHYRNVGTDTLSGVLKIKYDSLFDNFGTSNPSVINDSVLSFSNDTLTWQYFNLMPGEVRYFNTGGLDTNAIPGEIHEVIVTGYPLINDVAPSSNYDTCYQTVLGSWDPNFKEVKPDSNITFQQVVTGVPLIYTIHFQNTGNDTAYVVKIRDTLSTKLDMSSFEMISASHPYSMQITGGKIIEWKFDNIMLPDSGANKILSNGYLKYRITPFTNLNEGDSITNNAAIYFDNNLPVITNKAVTHIELTTNTNVFEEKNLDIIIYPNPTNRDFKIIIPPLTKQIRITNSIGQIVQSTNVDRQTNFNFTLTNHGIYFVQIITDKKTVTKKLIVTN